MGMGFLFPMRWSDRWVPRLGMGAMGPRPPESPTPKNLMPRGVTFGGSGVSIGGGDGFLGQYRKFWRQWKINPLKKIDKASKTYK